MLRIIKNVVNSLIRKSPLAVNDWSRHSFPKPGKGMNYGALFAVVWRNRAIGSADEIVRSPPLVFPSITVQDYFLATGLIMVGFPTCARWIRF